MICECGNNRFYATSVQYNVVIVDGFGQWEETIQSPDDNIEIEGPYKCTRCGMEHY